MITRNPSPFVNSSLGNTVVNFPVTPFSCKIHDPSLPVMAQSFFDEIKNQLECSVCQKQFDGEVNEPKILKCLHTFCKTCVEAWLRQQRRGAFSCPTCREVTECPNNNIGSLPSNLFCKQLVEILKAYKGQGQEDSPHCGNCEKKKELKFYCSDCHFFLCEECVEAHRKWKNFSGHEGKEIEKFKLSDAHDYARRGNVCKKHRDELRFYCEKCQVCICRDCAILEHQEDHKKISLDQGYKNNIAEIEPKMCKVRANCLRLKTHRESLEKRKQRANSGIEEATKVVRQVIERCISLIRQHETSVIERLVRHKETIQDAYDTQMISLDAKLMEIEDTLEFSEDVVVRNNLPEILKVKATIERRLQELSAPFEFMPNLDCSGVKYVQNEVSSLKDAPGNLVTTKTEPSLSVAEGKSLTEAFVGEHCTFTVITKNSAGLKTYSETDEVNVEIVSVAKKNDIKPLMTDLKDGRYSISYIPTSSGEFNLSIKVSGNSIMDSPFKLKVTPGNKYLSVKLGGSNQCKSNNRHFPSNNSSDTSSKKGNSILHVFNPFTPRINYEDM